MIRTSFRLEGSRREVERDAGKAGVGGVGLEFVVVVEAFIEAFEEGVAGWWV